jgi:hypothetical protein
MSGVRVRRALAVAVVPVALTLSGCSHGSPASPVPPSTTPSTIVASTIAPITGTAALCSDVPQVEQLVSDLLAGRVAPAQWLQRLAVVGGRLVNDSLILSREGPNHVSDLAQDLSIGVAELRESLRNGDALAALATHASRIEADIRLIAQDVCG